MAIEGYILKYFRTLSNFVIYHFEYWLQYLTPFLRVPLEIVVWIFDTFDNNLGSENNFTKHWTENWLWCSDYQFSFKYFPDYAFGRKISPELPDLQALIG